MSTILTAAAVLIVIVILWFMVYYRQNPYIDKPDGKASLKGECGDAVTMEISIKVDKDGKIADCAYWTTGCGYSVSCAKVATDLTKGKTTEEISCIDADLIQRSIGGIAEGHMHCARLAANTLRAALKDYKTKEGT